MSELTSLRPTQTVSVRDMFGIDSDLQVPAFTERDEHVPLGKGGVQSHEG